MFITQINTPISLFEKNAWYVIPRNMEYPACTCTKLGLWQLNGIPIDQFKNVRLVGFAGSMVHDAHSWQVMVLCRASPVKIS
jgi:hypothetical protein